MRCILAELYYPGEKKNQLSLFESGHLFEHDLLLLSAAVLMGIFNLLLKLSIFIISWFSYGKYFLYWKLNLLLMDRLVEAVYCAYEGKHWEYKSGKSLSLFISPLWLQTGTILYCSKVHAVILISIRWLHILNFFVVWKKGQMLLNFDKVYLKISGFKYKVDLLRATYTPLMLSCN